MWANGDLSKYSSTVMEHPPGGWVTPVQQQQEDSAIDQGPLKQMYRIAPNGLDIM